MDETVKFTLTKVNKYGKKQTRTLILSPKGITNSSGLSTKWEKPKELVHALFLSKSDPKSFVIQTYDNYVFETDSVEQVQQVAEAFKKLKLGEILYSDALNGENEDELQTQ